MKFFGQEQNSSSPESYEINGQEYHELNLLAEGGYGFIWRAIETKTRKLCVIKKIICQSDEAINQAKNEIELHSKLKHPNIVQCYNGCVKFDSKKNQTIAYLVLEICEGGTLIDLLKKYNDKRLNEQQILLVLRQLVQGIKCLHTQSPPIFHRDLKVENILLHNKMFKICDFGSASTERIDLSKITKQQQSIYEEIFSKNTTEIYRPPEMLDLYMKYEINEKVDIWMLGCILYTMCFYCSPFQEANKLAIIQADYQIPKDHKFSKKMIELISVMLQPNPNDRFNIFQIETILDQYNKIPTLLPTTIEDDEFDDFQSSNKVQNVNYDDSLI